MIKQIKYWLEDVWDWYKDPDTRQFKRITGYTFCYDLFWNIKDGICNIITWWPVIWCDRWWDMNYMYKIFKKKIDLMEVEHRLRSHLVKGPKTAKHLKMCSLLLDRLIKDEYYEKTHNPTYNQQEDFEEWIKSLNRPKSSLYIKQMRWSIEKENNSRQQDIDTFCKIISKHVQSFWD